MAMSLFLIDINPLGPQIKPSKATLFSQPPNHIPLCKHQISTGHSSHAARLGRPFTVRLQVDKMQWRA